MTHIEPVWDTVVSIHIATDDVIAARRLVIELVDFVHRVDDVLSTFNRHSDISRWRRGDAAISDCDPMLAEVLSAACDAYAATSGHFDPYWRGGAADPTGLVKGWAVDRAMQLARRRGQSNVMINAGGDVRAIGTRSEGDLWRVGIECPWAAEQLLDVVTGTDVAVATSGTYQRGAHILRDGVPVTDLLAVTVVGPNLTMADAFSTAAFACGRRAPSFLRSLPDEWRYLVVDRSQTARVSTNWSEAILSRHATVG